MRAFFFFPFLKLFSVGTGDECLRSGGFCGMGVMVGVVSSGGGRGSRALCSLSGMS